MVSMLYWLLSKKSVVTGCLAGKKSARTLALSAFFLILVLLAFGSNPAFAQDIKVTARVDSNNIMIGDWLALRLEVQHKDNTTVTWPSVPDSLQGIEIIKRGEIQTQKVGSDVLEKAEYIITSFDSGTVVVPPLPFYYSTSGDTTKRLAETSPIPIFIHTVEVDTSKPIKDIKPPLTLSITFMELLPYILVLIGIGLLGWLFYYVWNKRRKGESLIPEAPKRPAHELAFEALRSLDSEHLWQRGKVKEYYSQLTDIVRTYIEGRYEVKAMEMVTDEILSSPEISSLSNHTRESLRELLVLSDFVKFAKLQPTQIENETSIGKATSFVELTWHEADNQPQVLSTPEVNQ